MPKNNSVDKVGKSQPDDYLTHINFIPPKVHTANAPLTSIWQHKIQAHFEHQKMHEEMRYGGGMPTAAYDPKCYEMKHRWHEQYTKRGQSTFCRSKDGIVGA